MQKLLNPAITLLNGLRYPQKFLLISILFIVPLALVIALLTGEVNARADFAQQERAGNTYLRAVRRLFDDALQERLVAHASINGDTTLQADLARLQAQVDADLVALAAVDQELGPTLQTTEKFNTLNADWQNLKSQQPNSRTRLSDDLHATFIADIRALISLAGDTSNLILDPDLDSYYLMDSVLLKLPEQQDLAVQTQLIGERIITQRGFTADDKTQLTILSGLLRSNINAVSKGINTAFRNNPAGNASPALNAPLQAFSDANKVLLDTIDLEISAAPTVIITADRFRALTNNVHATSFDLWDRAVNTLDDLLQARINAANEKKNLVTFVTTLVLMIVLYLWVAFYVAVRRTVASLEATSQRMLSGDMTQALRLESQDELGDVARSFNNVASALIASSTYQRAVLDNAVDGIITIAADGRIDSFNPAAERMFGYSAGDIVGQDIRTLIPEPHDRQYQIIGVGREVIGRRQDATAFALDLAVGEMQIGDQHRFIGIAHDLTERKREAEERARLQEAIIRAQAAALAELSTPLIPISDAVVVMPLIGALDSQRAQQVLEGLLRGIELRRARVAILDITGVPVVDMQVAKTLISAARGVQLLGAQVVLTGIRPEVAQTLVGLGIDLGAIVTHSTLQSGIAYAIGRD